ncbi:MAG: PLP-dependent aspartate aminotransferase family protein [bacterium]|nr:PLP-dependent aspartate aminotransferase family protein [bacterium]
MKKNGIGTKAIHSGQRPEEKTGAVIPPIYQTSTFAQKSPGKTIAGYDYTRAGNPNYSRLEETLASLEGGKCATVFSSGLGATTAWLTTIGPGRVVANEDLYGGTYRLLTAVFQKYGVKTHFVQTDSLKSWEAGIDLKPDWLFVETPTNPLLKQANLRKICRLAHSKKVRVIVDNTFATPYFQKPLELGADVVLHSTTKYLGGHSDLIGGVLITNDKKLKSSFDFARKAVGLNPSPFDCWLASRGVKTLAVRMEQHQKNARAVVSVLKQSAKVRPVFYAGFGGMVSAQLKNGADARKFIKGLQLFTLAESLGGVESLICLPAAMTHASIPPKERARIGLGDGLVRLSVGIETTRDLVDDVSQSLKRL